MLQRFQNGHPFPDVLVARTTNGFEDLKVYKKPTHTNSSLNAISQPHQAQKRSLIGERICDVESLAGKKDTIEEGL